jgi:hypothetical protein
MRARAPVVIVDVVLVANLGGLGAARAADPDRTPPRWSR